MWELLFTSKENIRKFTSILVKRKDNFTYEVKGNFT